MLRIFGKNNPTVKNPDDASDSVKRLDIAGINEVVRCFPIGKKIRYFPEFQKQLVLDSIIIAYSINKVLVYSLNDLRYDVISGKDTFYIRKNGDEQHIQRVTGFSIIIPDNSDDNAKLDYSRKAELGKTAFRSGNNITLIASNMDRGIPHLDTTVSKTTTLKEGYYSNHKVVFLDTSPDNLAYIDQRLHYRFKTWIRASLGVPADGDTINCYLYDFSEECFLVKPGNEYPLPGKIADNAEVVLTASLDETSDPITLRGTVLRNNKDGILIALKGILKGGTFVNLDLIDLMAIKTSLLQHPRTQQD